MKLHGRKTILRAVEPHDVTYFFKWENDTENWLVSGTNAPFSRHDLERYVRSIRDIYTDKQLRLVISTEEAPVGCIDLFDFEPTHQRAGVGILIGESQVRRQGLAEDALLTTIDYAFDVLMLHQLYANIPANNEASIRLFEKLGFVNSGRRRDWLQTPLGFTDELFYQLIRQPQ
jgi:diamine N-acetyltransferase